MEGRFRPSTGGVGQGAPYRDSVDMSRWNSRTTTVFNVLDKRLENRVCVCLGVSASIWSLGFEFMSCVLCVFIGLGQFPGPVRRVLSPSCRLLLPGGAAAENLGGAGGGPK